MMKSYSQVSIVVPVYNVANYCSECFDSLLAIDYPNKEIILVDDCSTDGSNETCDKYAETHQEVTVIHHQQNSGVTQARLTGVKHAHGAYVMFVDSDDYVDPNILNKMTVTMIHNEADMVCCQTWNVYGGTKKIEERSIFGTFDKNGIIDLISHNLLFDKKIKRAGMPLYLCGKLFKRSIIKEYLQKGIGIKCDEDVLTVIDMLANKTQKLVILEEPFYFYRHHDTQVTSKKLWELYPSFIKVWGAIDEMNIESCRSQLSERMWTLMKPSIYDNRNYWGGLFRNNKYIDTFRVLRNSPIVNKYIWNNKEVPNDIKKHPHFILLKRHMYILDYIMYLLIWTFTKK